MNSFELLLSLLFVVVIYLIVAQKLNYELIAGITALGFVMLYNNSEGSILTHGVKGITPTQRIAPISCQPTRSHSNDARQDDNTMNYDPSNVFPDPSSLDEPKSSDYDADVSEDEKPLHEQMLPDSARPKPLEYSENNYKKNIFDEIGSLGDNKLAHRMKYLSNMNRVAIDNNARTDKYTNINYIAQELDDHANSVWWDDDVALEPKF